MPGTTSGRSRNTVCMTKILEAEAQKSDTDNQKKWHTGKQKNKANLKETNFNLEDDAEFVGSYDSGSLSDESDEEIEISNKEVILT